MTGTSPGAEGAFRRSVAAGSAGRFRRWVAACLERRRSRGFLAQASPETLKDIGISRADAWRECRKPCWRP